MKKLLNSKQVNTRLPLNMVQQIKYIASQEGITEGSIIESALKEFLGKTEHEEILLKKVDKLSRQIEKLRRENNTLFELFSCFVRVYLTHSQSIPESNKLEAEKMGELRFSKFMKLVASELERNDSFFNELQKKQFERSDFA